MAVGYFSRALRRAGPPPGATPVMPARPAEPLSSPVAEEDQRLNLDPEFMPAAPASDTLPPDAARAPPSSRAEMAERSGPSAPPADARPTEQPGRVAADPDLTPTAARDPEPLEGPRPQRTSQTNRPISTDLDPAHPPIIATEQPAPTPQAPRAEAERTERRPEPERPVPMTAPETALERMTRAINIAERWVAEDAGPRVAEPSDAVALSPPQAPRQPVEVAPVLQNRPEMQDFLPATAPPRVEIGRIEVEVMPPPAARAQTPAPRRAPAKPGPRPTMPFGWRQR